MSQGHEGWIRPLGTDQGSTGRIKALRDGLGLLGKDRGPAGRIRAPQQESGPRGSGKGPRLDVPRHRKTNQDPAE